MREFRRLVSGVALLGAIGMPAWANLILNPSFELPVGTSYISLPGNSTVITGWTTVNSGVEWYNAATYGYATAGGVMIVDLANYTFSSGGIEQTFATTPGTSYTIGFNLSTQAGFGRTGTAHIDVTLAGQTYGYDLTNLGVNPIWEYHEITFTANGAATTLRFTNNQNANLHFANVDGVSAVEAIPEPATAGAVLAGCVAWVALRRKSRR